MTKSAGGNQSAGVEEEAGTETEVQELPTESASEENLQVSETAVGEVSEVEETISLAEAPIDSQKNPTTSTSLTQWKSLATFTVEFQTRNIDGQTEHQTIARQQETEYVEQWIGIADQDSSKWILDRLAEAMVPITACEAVGQPEATQLTATSSFDLEIRQIRAIQPTYIKVPIVTNSTQRVFAQTLSSQAPFLLEVTFSMVGLNASEMIQQSASYEVEVYITNHEETKSIQISQSGTLIPEKLTYTEVLHEIRLNSGVYHLEALVRAGSVFSEKLKVLRLQVV